VVVEEFNTNKGIYIFEFDELDTEFHSHPAIEIIIAKNGCFTLWTDSNIHKNLKFAIISANQKHKLYSINCKLKVIMIEHHSRLVVDKLRFININLNNVFFSEAEIESVLNQIDILKKVINDDEVEPDYDYRITKTIAYLNETNLDYHLMISTLKAITHLSESRLSHLFKINVGISLKKYLIWTKLKFTIKDHLHSGNDLLSALLESGFYDQPHFSNSFKNMLGVKPSKVYNSRNLQV
tara:strand:- start:41728 stop:42441 length:714 start_codon:yes stop_codon:yes gene_type:complete